MDYNCILALKKISLLGYILLEVTSHNHKSITTICLYTFSIQLNYDTLIFGSGRGSIDM